MTQRLFMRSWRVQVGPFATTDLDCSFKIERTTAARPGTCELTLYNLSAEHRAQISCALEASGFPGIDLDELDFWAFEAVFPG